MLSFLRSHAFERASQAAAFAGLVPIQRQSGSSIHGRSRLSKAGSSKIRAGLYMDWRCDEEADSSLLWRTQAPAALSGELLRQFSIILLTSETVSLGLSKVKYCLRKGIETFKAKMRQCKHHR